MHLLKNTLVDLQEWDLQHCPPLSTHSFSHTPQMYSPKLPSNAVSVTEMFKPNWTVHRPVPFSDNKSSHAQGSFIIAENVAENGPDRKCRMKDADVEWLFFKGTVCMI